MRDKNWFIKGDMKEMYKWDYAEGCFANDRILVDGCKVGYMYREEPEGDFDSGWRFLAGDESDEYMDNTDNAGIYKLNTIANYDPDIIPFLYSVNDDNVNVNNPDNFLLLSAKSVAALAPVKLEIFDAPCGNITKIGFLTIQRRNIHLKIVKERCERIIL